MRSVPPVETAECLICGSCDDPTVEHIIPQTLWERFGIDPNRDDLAVFRTVLCDAHNQATGTLHGRDDVMDLFEHGGPITRKSLAGLAEWITWVMMLFGLSRGSAVLGAQYNRDELLRRFTPNSGSGGPPGGLRVYAARVSEQANPADPPATSYMVALGNDDNVVRDARGRVVGISVSSRTTSASESIIIGKFALLVLGRTISSGPGHKERLDEAAASQGLERIFPLPTVLPALMPRPISSHDMNRLFTVTPFAHDHSLAPVFAVAAAEAAAAGGGEWNDDES